MHHSCPPLSWDQTLYSGLAHLLKIFLNTLLPQVSWEEQSCFCTLGGGFVFSQAEGVDELFTSWAGRKIALHCAGLGDLWSEGFTCDITHPNHLLRAMASVHTGWRCPLPNTGEKKKHHKPIEHGMLNTCLAHIKPQVKQWQKVCSHNKKSGVGYSCITQAWQYHKRPRIFDSFSHLRCHIDVGFIFRLVTK